MFNTGTVVDVSANIFGAGFMPNYIPSFAWGGAHGFTTFMPDKALQVAELVMGRRNIALDTADRAILEEIFRQTAPDRRW